MFALLLLIHSFDYVKIMLQLCVYDISLSVYTTLLHCKICTSSYGKSGRAEEG
jgi:hypothetical protein